MKRKRYTGDSRTTRWRRRNCGSTPETESSSDSDAEGTLGEDPKDPVQQQPSQAVQKLSTSHVAVLVEDVQHYVATEECYDVGETYDTDVSAQDERSAVVHTNHPGVGRSPSPNTFSNASPTKGLHVSGSASLASAGGQSTPCCSSGPHSSTEDIHFSTCNIPSSSNQQLLSTISPLTSNASRSETSSVFNGEETPSTTVTSQSPDTFITLPLMDLNVHSPSTDDSNSKYSSDSDQSDELSSNSSDDDFSSGLESFECHCLEVEPQHNQRPILPGYDDVHEPKDDRDDPDDPDDPGGDDNPHGPCGDPESDESDEDVNEEAANFAHDRLNVPVNIFNNLTKGEIILLELASSVRHNRTFLSTLDHFKNLNLMFGPKVFPECVSALWNSILLNKSGIQSHVYCGHEGCGSYIGRKNALGDLAVCGCGYQVNTNKAKYFVTLNLRRQLQHFLCIPGMWEKLRYPERRQKISPTGIEDILDGSHYQSLKAEGAILSSPYNFSYVFSSDGYNPTKKGTLKMWPIYIRLNEPPPELRQKFAFVAAIFVDHVDPNFHAFLKPFIRQANSLSSRRVTWKPDGVNEVSSLFVPFCHCDDSPARYAILDMSHWNSDFGCTYCTHRGVQAGGNQRYSFLDVEGLPPIEERTHEGMQIGMVNAERNHREFVGHRGASPMLLLEHHNLRDGQAQDDLHQDHLGCAADVTEMLLRHAPRINPQMAFIELLRSIDRRLLQIKPPSRISRTPRSIQKRHKYSGTEWRNWLMFYSIPCLTGLVNQEYVDMLALLSHACYLLSQDTIEPHEVDNAERLLQRYGRSFEERFHRESIKFNLHVTVCHKPNSVRKLGPSWAYSTYNFESLHRKLSKFVTSPKGAIIQMITRSLLNLTVHSAQYDERVQERVRDRVEEILNKQPLKRVHQVGNQMYLVGKGTAREPTPQEEQVLAREGFHVYHMEEYKSFLIGSTRFTSVPGQNPAIKSNDTFIYTHQDTFCTIRNVIKFMDDNGDERVGLFVIEHDVDRPMPIARHISILRGVEAELNHYIPLHHVRCPAIKMSFNNQVYAVCIPNCYDID